MIKQILTFAFLLVASFSFAQAINNGPSMSLNKDVHDYGTIKKNGNGTATFTITNNATAPLIIENAKGSCGCTVPDWPRKPIAPGQSEEMIVKYDTKRVGPINKSVTIYSNDPENATKVVRIKGTVEDDGSNVQTFPAKKSTGAVPVAN